MSVDVAKRRAEHVAMLESELPRLVEGLKGMGAELIVLFGSYAQGRRDLFTDLDILAVLESDVPFLQRMIHLRETLRPRVATDLLVYTRDEFTDMKERPFVKHVLATGTVLHAAA
jgi:predicted nucleotidyltransferase